MNIPLRELGLQEKWPRLAELQSEVPDLNRKAAEAEARVSQAQTEVEAARRKDIEDEAEASVGEGVNS